METLTAESLASVIQRVSALMDENRQRLIDLDGSLGDGDLGLTMSRGFQAAANAASGSGETDIGKLLLTAGLAMGNAAPSTMGTLLAAGFMAGGKVTLGTERLELPGLALVLRSFCDGIMRRGKAKPGEKTIVDVLDPAARALDGASRTGATLKEAVSLCYEAALQGHEAARGMTACHGRPAYYGEKTRGQEDPGSAAGLLIVQGLRDFITASNQRRMTDDGGKTMDVTCSTVCLVELPLERALRKISDAGFDSLELLAVRGWIGEYVHVDAVKTPAAEVRKKCLDTGMRLASIHAGSLNTTSDEALKATVDYLKATADMALSLGAGKVVVTGGPRGPQGLERYIRGLRDTLDHIRGSDVEICIENHYQCVVESAEELRKVASELDHPQIGLTVDTGHFTASGISLDEVLQLLGPYIHHVHIKDHKGTQSVALGQGETQNREFVRKLRNRGYKGELCMELEVADKENVETYMREGRAYMAELAK